MGRQLPFQNTKTGNDTNADVLLQSLVCCVHACVYVHTVLCNNAVTASESESAGNTELRIILSNWRQSVPVA